MTQVIEALITDVVDIYRLTRTGDKEEYALTPEYTGLNAQILPATEAILAVYPGLPAFSLFEIYLFVNNPIAVGDKIISGGNEYMVRGVSYAVDTSYMTYQQIVGQKVQGS